jgi:hypothetical protein
MLCTIAMAEDLTLLTGAKLTVLPGKILIGGCSEQQSTKAATQASKACYYQTSA